MAPPSANPDERFAFGENWQRFLAKLDDRRIAEAERSLTEMLGTGLDGLSFLDVGCGSGLFSLAARRLGASVRSFDYDPASVRCAEELRRRDLPGDDDWVIEQASVLDREHLAALGTFDVVYSWGVLHHTGHLWEAMDNVTDLVAPGGLLFIAIYNDQGLRSRMWTAIRRRYNTGPHLLRALLLAYAVAWFWVPRAILDTLSGHPLRRWTSYRSNRGMSPWTDLVDWVGGYPFEVAAPDRVVERCERRGFDLRRPPTLASSGCNEFVFRKRGAR